MIVLKAILGAFFAVGVIAAAIVTAAVVIRTVRILLSESLRWYRRVRGGRVY